MADRLASKSTKQSAEEEIIHQLLTLGVTDNRQEIVNAMKHVVNRNDINEITDYIVNKQNKEYQIEIQNDMLDDDKHADKQTNENQVKQTQKVVSEDNKDELKEETKETGKESKKSDVYLERMDLVEKYGAKFE
eukprot:567444_1